LDIVRLSYKVVGIGDLILKIQLFKEISFNVFFQNCPFNLNSNKASGKENIGFSNKV
jgi:hypothetical protein